MERSIVLGGDPKGVQGGERKATLLASWATTLPKKFPPAGPDEPTPAQEQGLQPYGALYCFEGRTEGFQRASGKPFGAPAGAIPCPRLGLTRRLRRGLGLAVPRGAHTFLSVAKEKCAKERQRHGDSGKKPFIAHF